MEETSPDFIRSEEVEDMGIEAIKPTTSTPYSELAKDPPWSSQDLDKLRLLMDQGVSITFMAKEIGTTIPSVRQQIAALSQSDTAANPAGSSSVPETTSPPTGNNVNIKV